MRSRSRPLVILLLAALACIAIVRPAAAQSVGPEAAPAAVAGALRAKALAEGEVHVIVRMSMPAGFAPESTLSSTAIASQRSAIATARSTLRSAMQGWGATEYASLNTLPYVALKVSHPALERLLSSPLVTHIQEDALLSPQLASSTALVGANTTVAAGFRGANWTVVILDTGIDANHPFLSGRVVWQHCFSNGRGDGATLCPGGGTTEDGPGAAEVTDASGNPIANCRTALGGSICDHGTHVAGIAAGEDVPGNPQGFTGVAPDALIVPIQVFTRFDTDTACDPWAPPCLRTNTMDLMRALEYVNTTLVPAWNIAAVNMSLGGGQFTTACDSDALKAPIDSLLANGVATVVASGNDGWTDTISHPACISTAVAVGAVTDAIAPIFNMGSLVDILAPGDAVTSSVPDDTFATMSGTSMATPHVTGAFAVIRSIVGPSWSVAEILELLQDTGSLTTDTRPANNPGGEGSGTATGYVRSLLRLDMAVAELEPAPEPQPDLTITAIANLSATAAVGGRFTLTVTTQNIGTASAAATTVSYSLGSHVINHQSLVPSLAPGASSAAAVAVPVPINMIPGTYVVTACVHPVPNEVLPAGNNCRNSTTSIIIRGLPDLVVTSLTNPPATAAPGSRFTVTVRTANAGGLPAAPTITSFFLMKPPGMGWGPPISGTQSVPSLAAGVGASRTVELTIWPAIAPSNFGTYVLRACADTPQVGVSHVDEGLNESNNCRDAGTIVVGRPDLVVTAVSNPPARALPGARFSVTDTAANQGTITAGGSTSRYYLSDMSHKHSGSILLTGSRSVPSLAPGAISTRSASVTIPTTTPLGTYYLLACADDAGAVTEQNETNCRSAATTIVVGRPDLVEAMVTNPPPSAAPGARFSVTDTAANQGDLTAGTSTTRYYFSLDTAKGTGDRLLTGSRSVPSLGPGASSTNSVTVTIPAATPLGTYYLLACADDTGSMIERTEANNCRASATRVVVAAP